MNILKRLMKPATVLGFLLVSAVAAFAAPLTERDDVWAQTYSDIAADPDVRFGQLPNGMRYAIMHNALPVGQVSLRLAIRTGSVAETDKQLGLAHFLEHLAFKGSTKIAPDEMIKLLERLGLSFGGDTNASTSMDETVYRLDLPRADAETLDTGLMVLREVASELTLSQTAMDSERGVILSEERVSDTPSYRVNAIGLTNFLFPNQLVAKRLPIGDVNVIKSAPVSEIASYYRAHYRPDRTTLIIAGDIDVSAIEAKITPLFSTWQNNSKVPEPDRGRPAPRKAEAKVIVEPGVSLSLGVYWMNPYDNAADTKEIRRRDLVRGLGLAVVNRRMARVAQQPNPPFRSASVDRSNAYRSADIAELSITATPETWEQALMAAEALRRQAVEFGITQDELDTALTESRTRRQSAVTGASTRRTPQLAGGLLGAALGNTVVTSPAQGLAMFEEAVKGLTVVEVNAALREIFQGAGPLIFMGTPEPVAGGEATLLAALNRAQSAPVEAPPAVEAKTWNYAGVFGTPGKEVERSVVADLDTTFIRFANGVRLTVKPTTFSRDQIVIRVRVGDGLLGLPSDKMSQMWTTGAFIAGGLVDLNPDELRRIFSDKVAGVSFGVGEESFELQGGTRAADLDIQMQWLAAQMTAPGYRAEAFERLRLSRQQQLERVDATPSSALGYRLAQLMHGGDLRWRQPDRADLAAAKPSDVRDMLQGPLSRGQIEIVIVGDTTVDQASAAVAATFGAMPARPKAAPPKPSVKFPAPTATPVTIEHKGRADQAIALLAWRTDDFFANPHQARATRMAEQIFQLRLIEQFRIAEGNSYSPGTALESSDVFPRYGYVMARVETPPAKIPRFFEEAEKIAEDMRTKGVTEDELQRAMKPRVAALERSKQTNGYWASALGGAQTDPRKLDAVRMAIPGLQKVTTADVQKAAALYFVNARAWKAVVLPQTPE